MFQHATPRDTMTVRTGNHVEDNYHHDWLTSRRNNRSRPPVDIWSDPVVNPTMAGVLIVNKADVSSDRFHIWRERSEWPGHCAGAADRQGQRSGVETANDNTEVAWRCVVTAVWLVTDPSCSAVSCSCSVDSPTPFPAKPKTYENNAGFIAK